MQRLYIVTGAMGHLGNTIIRMLKERGEFVRGLILPGETGTEENHIHYVHGDVRVKDSMKPLFEDAQGMQKIVIHTAGIIDISEKGTDFMHEVNVGGTKNVIDLCLEYQVQRLVYVSSVHAIPEKGKLSVMEETDRFSPEWVVGGYAKTKAEATQAVLNAVHERGLDAVVVHPSGILGPYDQSGNHLVQLVRDYIYGKLPACVKGGYDFVDVRDVAAGCLSAAQHGRKGECYILSNRHYEVKEVLDMVKQLQGGRNLPVFPMWLAKACAPIMAWIARIRRQRPLYTKYSLYTLRSNDKFSHDKATQELHYHPRDLVQTIADTIAWLHPEKKKGKRHGVKRKSHAVTA